VVAQLAVPDMHIIYPLRPLLAYGIPQHCRGLERRVRSPTKCTPSPLHCEHTSFLAARFFLHCPPPATFAKHLLGPSNTNPPSASATATARSAVCASCVCATPRIPACTFPSRRKCVPLMAYLVSWTDFSACAVQKPVPLRVPSSCMLHSVTWTWPSCVTDLVSTTCGHGYLKVNLQWTRFYLGLTSQWLRRNGHSHLHPRLDWLTKKNNYATMAVG
jgi:hypothetical protein